MKRIVSNAYQAIKWWIYDYHCLWLGRRLRRSASKGLRPLPQQPGYPHSWGTPRPPHHPQEIRPCPLHIVQLTVPDPPQPEQR